VQWEPFRLRQPARKWLNDELNSTSQKPPRLDTFFGEGFCNAALNATIALASLCLKETTKMPQLCVGSIYFDTALNSLGSFAPGWPLPRRPIRGIVNRGRCQAATHVGDVRYRPWLASER